MRVVTSRTRGGHEVPSPHAAAHARARGADGERSSREALCTLGLARAPQQAPRRATGGRSAQCTFVRDHTAAASSLRRVCVRCSAAGGWPAAVAAAWRACRRLIATARRARRRRTAPRRSRLAALRSAARNAALPSTIHARLWLMERSTQDGRCSVGSMGRNSPSTSRGVAARAELR